MKKTLLNLLFSRTKQPAFSVNYWDGEEQRYGDGFPEFRVIFNKEPQASDLEDNLSLRLGESYMRGEIDLEGDYNAMVRALESYETHGPAKANFLKRMFILALGISKDGHGQKQQKENIKAHYDLGNDFFSLWLDSTLSYSCAYFAHPDDTLTQAQEQKIDLVLKKLRLQPGMRLLDIGCGWGELALRAASRYQASVVGITLSEEQYAKAKRRAAERGMEQRVDIRLQNYLDLDSDRSFDRIASVGMFEHVGQGHIPRYFKKIDSLLAPGGVSLLHTLTKLEENSSDDWIKKYIFPGGYIPSLRELMHVLPEFDFHAAHVESLRPHYVKTLEQWHANFSEPAVLTKTTAMYDREFVRMWSLYLLMAAAYLRTGNLDLHQIVFTKGTNNTLPLTLTDVYSE